MAQHGGHTPAGELGREAVRSGSLLGGDEAAVGDRRAEELGGRERLPVREPALGERAQDGVTGVEDAAVRVAERASLDPGRVVRYRSSFFRTRRKPRNRRQ
jgi:hypothetical protein